MEKSLENKEEKSSEEQYLDLIGAYWGRVLEIKKLERRVPGGVVGKEIATSIRIIDQERHEIHLKLRELGEQIGKNKEDVLVDIIRKDGTLDEYNLPEFSILTEDDIIDTGDWHNPFYFNVDTGTLRPSKSSLGGRTISEGESLIKPDEVMIVFAIVPIVDYGGEELRPEDYDERVERAEALAKEVGGKVFEEADSGYHEAEAKILGVVISKKDLEKVTSVIRNNPEKYRLGNKFYPDKTKSEIELLKMANSTLEKVIGEKSNLKQLPALIEGTEVLKNKTIIMVDDDGETLESFIPYLLRETEGKAIFIAHGDQSEEELLWEIYEFEADVVLLDFHLSMGINGASIAKKLKKSGFSGTIIGFSSDKFADSEFKKAGALGAINKDVNSPTKSLKKLAQILTK